MGYGNTEIFLSAQERVDLIGSLMGKTVDAVIDRPIGHTHVTKASHCTIPSIMGSCPVPWAATERNRMSMSWAWMCPWRPSGDALLPPSAGGMTMRTNW